MNEKTARQIEEMKKQTWGCEIEFNGMTRRKAAEIIAKHFGTHAYNAAARYGYMTWACEDNQGRVWKVSRDVSIDGPDDQKCELVTPIMRYEDIETLQEIVRKLRKAGGVAGPQVGAGVHVHVGLGDHTPQSLRALANIMAAHEEQIGQAIKLDSYRQARYCRVVDPDFLERLNQVKPQTMEGLKAVWYNGRDESNIHYSSTRYAALNYHACFTHGTVEFRLFQFLPPKDGRRNGLHAGLVKSYIQLALAISQLAKTVKYASPKKPNDENPKYSFRCWMLRLGFIGDEFKTARELLLKNMDGNSAWLHGRP